MPPLEAGSTRIQLCGRLKAEVEGRNATPSLRGRQGRILLAYLVLNRGRPVSRDELIESIWPQNPPADPPAALRTQLSRLRSAMGPNALNGRDTVELRLPEGAWIDVEAAERATSAAQEAIRAGDWKDAWAHGHIALNISGRPFLAGFEAPWVEEVRRELEEVQLRAREMIAQAGIGLGGSELSGAERSARALIRAAPFRESGYLHLMRALVASGNTAEALRTYDELRRLLAEELGSAPGAETQALHRRLLGGSDEVEEDRAPATAPASASGDGSAASLPLPSWLMPRRRSPFVGRASEVERLQEVWSEAQDGTPEIVLLGGDPGVGKTRLVTEFAQRTHAKGALVLYGRADEDSTTAFGPFIEALRHWAVNAPPAELAADLGGNASVLLELLPELAVRLESAPQPAAEAGRERLADALTGTIGAIAGRRPTLLVIDDLHWADSSTLLVLRQLARSSHRGRLTVCATYRQSTPSSALVETLADLGRERLVERIAVTGLGAEEVVALVSAIRGGPVRRDLAEAIHAETGGNPFLVEALADHIASGAAGSGPGARASAQSALYSDGVPPLVREAVTQRLSALGESGCKTLEVAAVMGADFSSAFVTEVSELPPEDVIGAMEAAVSAALLVDVPGSLDRYAFSHALLRRAVYADISKSRRAALHLRIAEALERRHGNDPRHVAGLASHFAGAGPVAAPRALEYCVRAGASALGALAYDEAREHYEQALAALDLTGSDDAELRCEILIALGEAEWRSGDAGAARDTYSRVLRTARRNGNSDVLGRAALGFSGFGWIHTGTADPAVAEILADALAAEPASRSLRARLKARLAESLAMRDERDKAMTLAAEAEQLAQAAGDREGHAQALIASWYAALAPGDLGRRRELADSLAAQAGNLRDRDILTQAEVVRVLTTLELGDFTELDVAVARHRRLADQMKQPGARLQSRAFLSMRALMEGRLAEAEGHTAEVLEVGELAGSPAALRTAAIQLLFLRWEQGRLAEMDDSIALLGGDDGPPLWQAARAFASAELGHRARARRQLEALLDGGFAGPERQSDWLGAVALCASAAHAIRDPEVAAGLAAALEPYAGRVISVGRGTAYAGSASRYLGLVALTIGDLDSAVVHLTEDIAINERAGALPWLARSRRDLARALAKRGRSGDAERAGQLRADSRKSPRSESLAAS